MMRIDCLVLALSFLVGNTVLAQDVLSRNEAISTYLESNYDIRMADNAIEVAEASATKVNVGYLPVVVLSGNGNGDLGSNNVVFQDGSEIDAVSNLTQIYGASVGVNYNIYQGKERHYNLKKLMKNVDLLEDQKRLQVEVGLVDLLNSYYDAANALENFKVFQELVILSQERLDRIKAGFEFGRGGKLEVLNAEVDLQRDETNLLNAKIAYESAKRNLLVIMGDDREALDFDVESEVNFNLAMNKEALTNEAVTKNAQLQALATAGEIIDYDLAIAKAQRRPVISLSAGYDYSHQDFGDAGFFARQNSNGLGLGLGISWALYDGGRLSNQKQIIALQKNGNALQIDRLEFELKGAISNLYDQYSNAMKVIEVEAENVAAAGLAFESTQEAYSLGRVGYVEFRQSQINLLNSELNWSMARFNAKRLEIQLKQLSGQLVESLSAE